MRYPIIPKMIAALYNREILHENIQNKSHKALKTQLKLKNNNKLIIKKCLIYLKLHPKNKY